MKRLTTMIVALLALTGSTAQDLKLWYAQPAEKWVEALPLGNGRLGVMTFGGTANEELQLNEETLWGGGPHRNDSPTALENLPRVRELIFAGKNREAQDLMEKTFRTERNGMPYQTIGSLHLSFPGHETATNYRRELDLERAVATTTYSVDGVSYRRELLTSFVDDVVIMRLTADKPGAITFNTSYTSPLKGAKKKHSGPSLVLIGNGQDHEGVKGVVSMETQTRVKNEGGSVSLNDSVLSVKGATAVTLYISAATNFVDYTSVAGNATKRASALMKQAVKRHYDDAVAQHVARYATYFNRVKFELPATKASKE